MRVRATARAEKKTQTHTLEIKPRRKKRYILTYNTHQQQQQQQ